MAELRIRQYVYFAIRSHSLPADQIERRLGMVPDEVGVAGSKSQDPMRPAGHAWKLVCNERSLTVESQIKNVLDRLRPAQAAIRELVATEAAVAVLQVVRYFDDEAGEHGDWQHHLLGWHLGLEQMRVLTDMGADVDVDEYG